MREQFKRAIMFWHTFFEGAILKSTYVFKYIFEGAVLKSTYVLKCIFWGSNLEEHLCSEMYFLMEQLSTFTAKSYSLINILFYQWLCGSVAKPMEHVAINMLSLWWREFESLEEQIFCNYYGRMKAYML